MGNTAPESRDDDAPAKYLGDDTATRARWVDAVHPATSIVLRAYPGTPSSFVLAVSDALTELGVRATPVVLPLAIKRSATIHMFASSTDLCCELATTSNATREAITAMLAAGAQPLGWWESSLNHSFVCPHPDADTNASVAIRVLGELAHGIDGEHCEFSSCSDWIAIFRKEASRLAVYNWRASFSPAEAFTAAIAAAYWRGYDAVDFAMYLDAPQTGEWLRMRGLIR